MHTFQNIKPLIPCTWECDCKEGKVCEHLYCPTIVHYMDEKMTVQNINPEKEPIPPSWVPKVIQGGKTGGPDTPGPPPGKDWLSDLDPGTVFICRENVLEVDFETYTVQYQSDQFTLLMEMLDNCELERRVGSKAFSNLYRDYHVIGFHPIEAPDEGDNNERHRPD